jgi:hypothetical protein
MDADALADWIFSRLPKLLNGICAKLNIGDVSMIWEHEFSCESNFTNIINQGGPDMANQVLKDKRGIRIGEISERSGKFIIRDAKGIKKGEFDPKTNVTRNAMGQKVGTGNLLTTLL